MTETTGDIPIQRELAAALSARGSMLLTTFKRDGTPVPTPVSVAVEGDRIFFRTYDKAWKARRLRHNPLVEAAPSTFLGKPRGRALAAHTRLLEGDEAIVARRLLARRHPLLQGVLVPLLHRLSRYKTLHYELTARAAG